MPSTAPEELRIGRRALTVLEHVLRVALPEEGCALLLGERQGTGLRLRRVWPCCNVWDPAAERSRRFALDPREQLLAQKWARPRGWQVLGSAHGHPLGPAVPSATDLALAFAPTLMLILDGRGVDAPSPAAEAPAAPGACLGCWWLEEPPAIADPPLPPTPRRLMWRMED